MFAGTVHDKRTITSGKPGTKMGHKEQKQKCSDSAESPDQRMDSHRGPKNEYNVQKHEP